MRADISTTGRVDRKNMAKQDTETDWAEVAAKAQAYQALDASGLNDDDHKVTEKAGFLMALGISRADAARMIGSTDESLRKSFEAIAKKAKTNKGRPPTGQPDGG
jgi:hypothetical protein